MSVSPSNLQSETISEHFSEPIARQMRWPRALNRELSTLFPEGERSPTAVTCLHNHASPLPFVEKTMVKRFSRPRGGWWMRFDVPKCRESKKLTTGGEKQGFFRESFSKKTSCRMETWEEETFLLETTLGSERINARR